LIRELLAFATMVAEIERTTAAAAQPPTEDKLLTAATALARFREASAAELKTALPAERYKQLQGFLSHAPRTAWRPAEPREPFPQEMPGIVFHGDYARVVRATTNVWHLDFPNETSNLHAFIDAASGEVLCIYLTIEG
jgi:hypothetical protein